MKLAPTSLLLKLVDDDTAKQLDRLAWYIVKMSGAVEDVKEHCVRLNDQHCQAALSKLVHIAREIDHRLGFAGSIAPLIQQIVDSVKSGKPKQEKLASINAALKEFVKRVMVGFCAVARLARP